MNHDPFQELATPLGILVISFNDLEVALGGALMRLLKNDDDYVGAVFVSVLGFEQRYRLLSALSVKIKESKVRESFRELLDDAKEIAERRNRFVHAEYTMVRSDDSQTVDFLHQRLKDFSKESRFDKLSEIFKYIAPVDPAELGELSDRAAGVAMKILEISERFYAQSLFGLRPS